MKTMSTNVQTIQSYCHSLHIFSVPELSAHSIENIQHFKCEQFGTSALLVLYQSS